jgi:hypothetical protein
MTPAMKRYESLPSPLPSELSHSLSHVRVLRCFSSSNCSSGRYFQILVFPENSHAERRRLCNRSRPHAQTSRGMTVGRVIFYISMLVSDSVVSSVESVK